MDRIVLFRFSLFWPNVILIIRQKSMILYVHSYGILMYGISRRLAAIELLVEEFVVGSTCHRKSASAHEFVNFMCQCDRRSVSAPHMVWVMAPNAQLDRPVTICIGTYCSFVSYCNNLKCNSLDLSVVKIEIIDYWLILMFWKCIIYKRDLKPFCYYRLSLNSELEEKKDSKHGVHAFFELGCLDFLL